MRQVHGGKDHVPYLGRAHGRVLKRARGVKLAVSSQQKS